MKRKICAVLFLLTIVITAINIGFVVKDSFFYSLDNIPTGTLIREDFDQKVLFSTGYKLKVYQVERTRRLPAGVRVELCNDLSGERRTIYWQTGTTGTFINWSDESDTIVSINGVTLDFSKHVYDCRDYIDHKYEPKN